MNRHGSRYYMLKRQSKNRKSDKDAPHLEDLSFTPPLARVQFQTQATHPFFLLSNLECDQKATEN